MRRVAGLGGGLGDAGEPAAHVRDLPQRGIGDLPRRFAGPDERSRMRWLASSLAAYSRKALLDPETERHKDAWDLAAFGHGGHADFGVGSAPLLRPAVRMQHGVSERASWAFRVLAGGFGRDGVGWRPAAVWRMLQSRRRAGLICMTCPPARKLGHP